MNVFILIFVIINIITIVCQYSNVCDCKSSTVVECCYGGQCAEADCKSSVIGAICVDPCPYDLGINVGACCDVADPPKEDCPRGSFSKCSVFGEPHVLTYDGTSLTCDMFSSPDNIISDTKIWKVTVGVDYGMNWPFRQMTKLISVSVNMKETSSTYTYNIGGSFGSTTFESNPCGGKVNVEQKKITLEDGSYVEVRDMLCHLNLFIRGHKKYDEGICSVGCRDNPLAVPSTRRDGKAPENPKCANLGQPFKDFCDYDVYLTSEEAVYSSSHLDSQTTYNSMKVGNVGGIVGGVLGGLGGVCVCICVIVVCFIIARKGTKKKDSKDGVNTNIGNTPMVQRPTGNWNAILNQQPQSAVVRPQRHFMYSKPHQNFVYPQQQQFVQPVSQQVLISKPQPQQIGSFRSFNPIIQSYVQPQNTYPNVNQRSTQQNVVIDESNVVIVGEVTMEGEDD